MRRPSRQPLASPESLEAILERAGESRFARAHSPIERKLWRDAVGPRIADRAHPVTLHDGVLLLRVSSSVWAHELSLLSDALCQRLRERGVLVRELRFRVATLPAPDRPPERRVSRTVPSARPLPGELVGALGAVADADLRSAIARAACANLAWQDATRPAGPHNVSEARRAARAPRSAAEESAPRGQTSPASLAADSGTRGGGRDRRR